MIQFTLRRLSLALLVMSLASCVGGANGAPTAASRYAKGIQLLNARDYAAAKAELTKAQPFKTGDSRALMALAVASDMTGDFRTSDRAYGELAKKGGDQVMLFNNMGYSYMLRGDLDRALSYLTEAARRDPNNPTTRNNMAMLRKVAPTR